MFAARALVVAAAVGCGSSAPRPASSQSAPLQNAAASTETPTTSDPGSPDPDHRNRVAGVIRVHPKALSNVAAGGAVFVIVKQVGPDGAPHGPPLAVDRLTWPGGELAFEISDAQAMVEGTALAGDVMVTVRYDHDADAITKEPGDVIGTLRVTAPARDVVIVLDDVLP